MATGCNLGMAAGTDIPVEHLDYDYIEECKNAREVEKILDILRWASSPRSSRFSRSTLQQIFPAIPHSLTHPLSLSPPLPPGQGGRGSTLIW